MCQNNVTGLSACSGTPCMLSEDSSKQPASVVRMASKFDLLLIIEAGCWRWLCGRAAMHMGPSTLVAMVCTHSGGYAETRKQY